LELFPLDLKTHGLFIFADNPIFHQKALPHEDDTPHWIHDSDIGHGKIRYINNVTFNNISVILEGETGVPRENHRPVASH
jgi:hypothetical protein